MKTLFILSLNTNVVMYIFEVYYIQYIHNPFNACAKTKTTKTSLLL